MSIKATKHLVLGLLLALTAIFVTGVHAQDCPPGLAGDDCALITTAFENTQAAESFALTFDMALNADLGFFATNINVVGGTGFIVMDGSGVITAARLDMPDVTFDMMFATSSGAASFILVDNFLYFGAGETLDALTWSGISGDDLGNSTFTFSGLASQSTVTDMAEFNIDDVPATWTRNDSAVLPDGRTVVQLSGSYDNVDPFAMGADASEMDFFGGMTGTLNGTNVVSIDPTTQTLAAVSTQIDLSYSFGEVDASGLGDLLGGLGELGGEEGVEGLGELGDLGSLFGGEGEGEEDPFGDMFGELFGSMFGGEGFSVIANTTVAFSGINEAYTVTAPDSFEPVSSNAASNLSFSFTDSLTELITQYYSELAAESAFDADSFGFGDFDFGAFGGEYFYSSQCVPGSRENSPAGSISFGQTVTGNLAEGGADLWTFNGNAGDLVTISLTSDIFDTFVELLGPSGGIASNDDGGDGLNSLITAFELTESGEHTVVACGWSSFASGEYSLTLSN